MKETEMCSLQRSVVIGDDLFCFPFDRARQCLLCVPRFKLLVLSSSSDHHRNVMGANVPLTLLE